MQFVFGVVVLVLLVLGARQLVNRATAAGQVRITAAKARLAAWRTAAASRPTPPPSPLAQRAGMVAGSVAQGAVLAWSAGLPGWRLGWALGREKVRDWWTRRQQQPVVDPPAADPSPQRDADGHLAFGSDPTDPNGTRECPQCHGGLLVQDGQQICPACLARQEVRNEDYEQQPSGRPNLRLVPNQPEPATGGPVSVIAALGGEIRTIADVRAAIEAVIRQRTAELEDAQAQVAREQESLRAAISLSEQSQVVLDKDPDGRQALAALVETASVAVANAEQRVANKDAELAQARQALFDVNAHMAVEEAVAGTPQASSNTEVYQPQ